MTEAWSGMTICKTKNVVLTEDPDAISHSNSQSSTLELKIASVPVQTMLPNLGRCFIGPIPPLQENANAISSALCCSAAWDGVLYKLLHADWTEMRERIAPFHFSATSFFDEQLELHQA